MMRRPIVIRLPDQQVGDPAGPDPGGDACLLEDVAQIGEPALPRLIDEGGEQDQVFGMVLIDGPARLLLGRGILLPVLVDHRPAGDRRVHRDHDQSDGDEYETAAGEDAGRQPDDGADRERQDEGQRRPQQRILAHAAGEG